MKKVAVVTATRAEYGILTPLIRKINEDSDLELQLIVTGTHLSEKYGSTYELIEKDGFKIAEKIYIQEETTTEVNNSKIMGNAIIKFAEYFHESKPDMLVLLGDRTEILGIACAAINARIPIAHLHGGEITEGAIDDSIRHSLTKLSYLHFPATEEYRKRIIQMGEVPERVYNVGALAVENILKSKLMEEKEVRDDLNISNSLPYAIVTFHPVTLEKGMAAAQTKELCNAMKNNLSYFYIITMSNSDTDGDEVNFILKEFAKNNPDRVTFVKSLGMKRYLSAVKYAAFVLGNSSSGIIEAPVFGTPTVNIGDRQKGRLMTETIINCEPSEKAITAAIQKSQSINKIPTSIYGCGETSDTILNVIKEHLLSKEITLKKEFYNIEFTL